MSIGSNSAITSTVSYLALTKDVAISMVNPMQSADIIHADALNISKRCMPQQPDMPAVKAEEEVMRILIIEDDKRLSYEIKDGLEKKGFIVDVSNQGIDGEEKAYVIDYEAILLDLNLPDKDGMDILTFLRENKRNIPVIILSARNTSFDRVLGLDLGADDYITKPFDFDEMTSRIHAVIRRFHGRTNPAIIIKKLVIDPQKRMAFYDGSIIELSAKEFDIICFLAEKHPDVVSSEMIAEHVYDEYYDPFSSVLRVHIANLRKKLKQEAGYDLLITKKGRGYQLWDK